MGKNGSIVQTAAGALLSGVGRHDPRPPRPWCDRLALERTEMMNKTTEPLRTGRIASVRQEQCSGQSRWTKDGRLQQLWVIKLYDGGQQVGAEREWRDVPTADE